MGRRRRAVTPSPADLCRESLRRRLLGGCAFAAVVLAPALAHAQLALDGGATQFSAGGQAPLIGLAGRTTDITLGAPRTILSWSKFSLGADQSVVYRFQDKSWIVLNKVSGQAVIDGQVEALVGAQRGAGNVWFSAPGGVLFGPNARVNVGGLLATSAAVVQSGFLDPSNPAIAFTGAGSGTVELRAGADVRASGGTLALIAGSVSAEDGSAVTSTGASTVLYGAANDFTVRFAAQAGDLDLLDFVVPAGGGTASATPLTLRGQTVGANVFLAVVNRADVASAVINAPGLIAAQTATVDRGDVVLAAGVGIANRQPGSTRLNTTTQTTASFGVVSAQRDLLGGLSQPTALTGGQFAAGRDLGLAAASLDVASLNAGRLLAVDAAQSLTLRSGASAGSAASLRTNGAFTVGGGAGNVNAIGRLQIDAGTVRAGQLNSGRSVVINAGGADGPAVQLNTIIADDDIAITTTGAAGHIVLGSAIITGARSDDAPAGRNLTLAAKGANADVTYGAPGGTPLIGVTRVNLSAGRDVTANVSGLLTLSGGSAGRNFTVRAGDVDIIGALTAPSIRFESLQGAMTLGGGGNASPLSGPRSAPAEGLRITDAEFQFLSASDQVGFYAGATTGSARGDLTVMTLHVDPAKTPNLFLGAGSGNTVSITGDLAPGVSGGMITVGDASADGGFQPGRITLSGSIGVARGSAATGFIDVHALGETHLNAASEIILGSPRFQALVAGVPADQIDLANDKPAGVAPTADEANHVWIATGVLTLSASARILIQNTGTKATPSGIFIDGTVPDPPPPGKPTLSISTTGVVDVFGSFRDMGGAVHGGLGAGLTPSLQVSGGVSAGGGGGGFTVRFNGLDVSSTAGGGGRLPSLLDPRVQTIAQGLDSSLAGPSDDAVKGPPEAPAVLTPSGPDEEAIVEDTVQAGTGSFEIWRRKPKRGR